jgi:LPXTG-motif cell wall-anchored protein
MAGRTFAERAPLHPSRVLAALLGLMVLLAAGGHAGAATPTTEADEDYPPDAIVNLLDPIGCDPVQVSGEIATVEPASTVTIQVILTNETAGLLLQAAPAGDVLGQDTVTADTDGQVDYTIPIETGRYGTAVVYATGTDTVGDPFALSVTVDIVACPPGQLPRTGNSNMTLWLQIAGVVLVAGVILAAAARRRHMRTTHT